MPLETIFREDAWQSTSMDNFEVNYFMSQMNRPENGLIRPLWSKTGYNVDDYYEFEVKTKENYEFEADTEIYHDHNYVCETYTCYICDINVPKTYWKDHNESKKHKVCSDIAKKSLERTSKHIKEEFNHETSIVRYDCYFCAPCCAAVASELKGDHENTPYHLTSVEHDELLEDLLKYFIDRDNVKMEFEIDKTKMLEKLKKINNKKDLKEDKASDVHEQICKNLGTNTSKTEKNDPTKIKSAKNNDSVNANATKNKTNINTNKNSQDLITNCANNGSKKAKNKGTAKTLDSIEDINSRIESIKTNPANVNTEANLTLNKVEINTGAIKKKINPVMNTENLENNKSSKNINDTKIDPVASPVIKLDDTIKTEAGDKEADEPQTKSSNKNKKKARTSNNMAKLNSYYKHLSLGHSLKLINNDLLEIKTTQCDVLRVAVDNFHGFINIDGWSKCIICSEWMIDGDTDNHIHSYDHGIAVMTPIIDFNCIRKLNINNHCILCNEIVEDFDKTNHISKAKHCSNMKKALIKQNTPDMPNIVTVIFDNSHKSYCEVCDTEVNSSKFDTHSKSKTHLDNYNRKYPSLLSTNSKIKKDDSSSKPDNLEPIMCKFCKLKILTKDVDSHFKGSAHIAKYNAILSANKINELENGLYCNVCRVTISLNLLWEHIEEAKHVLDLKNIKSDVIRDNFEPISMDKKTTRCVVCQVTAPIKLSEIDGHLNSESLLDNNKVLIIGKGSGDLKDDSGDYFCPSCNKIGSDNKIQHIASDAHIKTMPKNEFEMPTINITKHPYMEITSNPKELMCKICLKSVSAQADVIDEHIKGKNHTKKYTKLLKKFEIEADMHFCVDCNATVDNNNLYEHINCKENSEIESSPSSKSRTNNEKQKKETASEKLILDETATFQDDPNALASGIRFCLPCNVAVFDDENYLKIHLKGLKHRTNYSVFLIRNYIVDRNTDSYCNICRVSIKLGAEFDHVNSVSHVFKMSTKNPSVVLVSPIHYLMQRIRPNYLQCKICKIDINDDPLHTEAHLSSASHIEIYETIIKVNMLTLQVDRYFCELCKDLIEFQKEYDHVCRDNHRLAVVGSKESNVQYICSVCNVAVPNNARNKEEHKRGFLHQRTLLEKQAKHT